MLEINEMRLTGLTVEQLVDEYNSFGPIESMVSWTGGRAELWNLIRIARKQCMHIGIVNGVTITMPE